MPLSTTSPQPRTRPARAAASASASGRLRGSPRTSRTTQYAQAPAQPSWTLSTSRVRAPGVARGASSAAAASGPGTPPAAWTSILAPTGVTGVVMGGVMSGVVGGVEPGDDALPVLDAVAGVLLNVPRGHFAQSGRAATVTPSPSNCSGCSAAAQPATTTRLPAEAARRTSRRDLRSASAVTQQVCTTTTSAASRAVTGSRPAAARPARASSPSA